MLCGHGGSTTPLSVARSRPHLTNLKHYIGKSLKISSAFVLLISLVLVFGCSTIVTSEPKHATFLEGEYFLKVDAVLFASDCQSWSGEYMITLETQGYGNCLGEKIGKIQSGTRFRVKEIIEQFGGESGECWRIEIRILDGSFKGFIVDIPSCFLHHPKSWISSKHPFDGNALRFFPEIVAATGQTK